MQKVRTRGKKIKSKENLIKFHQLFSTFPRESFKWKKESWEEVCALLQAGSFDVEIKEYTIRVYLMYVCVCNVCTSI
jgi:hypothetical protein